MRRFLIGGALAVMLAGQAVAQGADAAIRGVIRQQLDAFAADDFATAFGFASPMIRQMFGTPENFGRMVMSGYPMVWHNSAARFTALESRDGRMYQNVLITDREGALHYLEYEMIQTGDGWEINGVRFKRPGAFGA